MIIPTINPKIPLIAFGNIKMFAIPSIADYNWNVIIYSHRMGQQPLLRLHPSAIFCSNLHLQIYPRGGTPLDTKTITHNLSPNRDQTHALYLQPGTVLEDRYQIKGIIGTGGMGAVYRSRDLRFSALKPVAIKEIVAQVKDEAIRKTLVSNFEREANLLATLNHSAIPKIHDYFTIDNHSYLVMEFVNGKNLETILDEKEDLFPVNQVVAWAIELCDVLHYLHTREPKQIIFRDMKPANVMITPSNHIVLVDFGIAKKFEAGQKGTMIGTEGYSPPEQYRGEASPQVDIYALGATLHHLLTGIDPRDEPPFTFAERPIRQLNPEVPVELETIVETALRYNASDRFEDAATIKKTLLSMARKSSVLYSNKATASIQQDYEIKPAWTFECEDEVRGSAGYNNGRIFIGSYDNNVYALNATTGEFIWKYAAEGGIVSTPAVYNEIIYFGSEDQRVHAVSESQGRVIWTYYTDGPVRSSPVIRDRHIFVGSDDGFLHVVNAKSGRRALKIDAGAPVRSSPLVTNDEVYFGTESGDLICSDFHGKIQWRASAKRAITSSPRIQENVVYFGSLDSMLYALDAKTGWTIWQFRMKGGTISTPYVTEHFVYIGSSDGYIYCINLQSSKKVWQFQTEHQISSSPTIYKDALYCGGVDGNIYCLDYNKGHLRWKYSTGAPISSSPIIHNDIVYIGSMNNHLYALPI
ncbi:MAG: serine/threonine-protein kinase [Chloroflexota bacterium]|nr:serine/threonine-protein kinase [Chloroflexota bacterium]